MSEPLLDNPRALMEKVAATLGGTAAGQAGLSGFVNSRFDRFFNQLFASAGVPPRDAVAALERRPGFVWLAEKPNADELGADGLWLLEMYGMTATTAPPTEQRRPEGEIGEVRSRDDLDGWFGVYSEVFGADPKGRDEWHRIYDALGPSGDGSLLLLLARVGGSPAATGATFFHDGLAGLYCFTTLEQMRARGLASALVHASHEAARERGFGRAVLHATGSGRPVYAKSGYREVRSLPVLVSA